MVIIKTWVPEHSDISVLSELSAPLCVDDYADSGDHPTGLRLHCADGRSAIVSADYGDVRFKFECFFITVSLASQRSVQWQPAIKIEDFQSIRLLIGTAWERPADPGELPAHYEQIVGTSGLRQAIPEDVLTIGIFVRGLAFWNDDKHCPVAAIVASHDVPGTLDILTKRNDLDAALVISEVVDLPSLKG